MDEEGNEKPVSRVRIAKGVMITTREQRDTRTFTLHNSDTEARQVVIEHPAREGWKLAEGTKPEETTASFLRFRVGVGPGKTETLNVEEIHPDEATYELTDLEDEQVRQITALVADNRITPALQKALRAILDQKNLVDGFDNHIKTRQAEIEAISKDQARVRENMKALKGTSEEKELLQRYTRQLNSQEDRLNTVQKEISNLQEKQTKADDDLEQMVQSAVLDESF
jgi:predicted ribosome quality control (RQC) complex YloA/Tae2 family protein